ncbi:hypothetical protein K1X13_01835 [Nocardioides sp. WL0053]|uniref:Uncharacterized protein n=1 Tax=Nocardioides jiangsuensis TaxID=2866161 RepID=A0ABS7RIZ5_9ACTN|nr:hypothetical protein [Nocardioides jiangsuensis]
MTLAERVAVIESCRYVDEVIEDAPLQVTESFLARRVEHRLQQVPLVIGQVTWVRHSPHGDHGNRPRNRDTHPVRGTGEAGPAPSR